MESHIVGDLTPQLAEQLETHLGSATLVSVATRSRSD